ncbi:DNA-binding transcriptional MerR regulator [Spinactinospora alkalitolerans]|uniref:DNA-binding transcriptional MerR regulator n=1 Tax=Spinactinospora alkalitolerans TaxID=687207 RepID=A0A852TNF8_9ACTN|nr:MerR family transcriptional regulator [Spinactinospora alkalitolerans]NYE45876.1 DNA-binding transcriptional MerR regulator [Spinactinospora alkalitolerans]
MKISELSRRSGVSVATIKYYLREGLLPKGEATAATQAGYSEAHVRRLRLIRALAEAADLPLARVKGVLDAVDDPEIGLHRLLGTALYELGPRITPPADDPEWRRAEEATDRLLDELGWKVTSRAPARLHLARTVATMARLGRPVGPELLRSYAETAHSTARRDLEQIDPDRPREDNVEHAIAMTLLLEQAFVAMRRLAQEDLSARRFTADPPEEC